MLASKNIANALLNEVIAVLNTVGLPQDDPFGLRGQIQRYNFDNGAFEYEDTDANVTYVFRKPAGADRITSVEVTALRTSKVDQEDIDFANEDLADILA